MQLGKEDLCNIFGGVEISERGCWLRTANRMANGYSQIRVLGKKALLHRVSYQYHHGPIPKGHVIMHSCDTRNCINPAHLSAGTYSENTRDMHAKGRGYNALEVSDCCKRGHKYTAENTAGTPSKRVCRICSRERQKAIRAGSGVSGRGHAKTWTHCKFGHPFEGNTYTRPSGGRCCLFCKREYERNRANRLKDETIAT